MSRGTAPSPSVPLDQDAQHRDNRDYRCAFRPSIMLRRRPGQKRFSTWSGVDTPGNGKTYCPAPVHLRPVRTGSASTIGRTHGSPVRRRSRRARS